MNNWSFRKDHGYDCSYYPTIMDGPVFRWTNGGIEISASRNGVGVYCNGMVRGLSEFKSVLDVAFGIYMQHHK